MIKAAFLNETPDTLRRVYAERQMARLNKLVQLYPAVITSVDEARAARDALKDIEVVFSTWGMPAMTEAEIKECFPSLKAVFYGAGSVQYFARPFLNAGVRVYSMDRLREIARRRDVTIGIVTVPVEYAQEVADQIMDAGINAIWNFTPRRISVRKGVVSQNTSLYSHLAVMYNRLSNAEDQNGEDAR